MKLQTLNYIHELLVKNIDDAKKDYEEARNNLRKFKLKDDFNYDIKNEEYIILRDINFSKSDVLEEAKKTLAAFEEQEW